MTYTYEQARTILVDVYEIDDKQINNITNKLGKTVAALEYLLYHVSGVKSFEDHDRDDDCWDVDIDDWYEEGLTND
jgi:hypothetical protein